MALALATIQRQRSTLHAPRFTLHTPRFTLHNPRFTLHSPRFSPLSGELEGSRDRGGEASLSLLTICKDKSFHC
jgi:hypothetical protein